MACVPSHCPTFVRIRWRTAQFEHNHRSFVLRERPQDLPNQRAARVVAAQVRLANASHLEPVTTHVGDDGFLNHQVAGEPVELLDQHELHTV